MSEHQDHSLLVGGESAAAARLQIMHQNKDNVTLARTVALHSPFDMEAIVRACPRLSERWESSPFVLFVGRNGVKVTYLD